MFFDLFKKKENKQIDPEQAKIDELLNEVREKGKLPIYVNADVQEALSFLAKSEGQIKLDDYTKGEILKIYERWQRRINKKEVNISKSGKGYGFEKPQEEEIEVIGETVWYNPEDGSIDYYEPEEGNN